MKQLPNILTLLNLFCGSIACIFTIKGIPPEYILVLVICSLLFDFFDGFVARAVHASGPLGKELDSLADMVTFGLLPGLLMFTMLGGNMVLEVLYSYFVSSRYDDIALINHINGSLPFGNIYIFSIVPFIGLSITLASAYRLAKFNLDEDQAYYFKGLPTPANTIFIFSIYWLIYSNPSVFWNNTLLLLIISIFCSILPVCNLPLLALKFKNLKWKDNSLIFSFLFICIILLVWLRIAAIPVIILIYILLSILFRKKIISNGTKTT